MLGALLVIALGAALSGCSKASAASLPTLSKVPAFSLTDEHGKSFSSSDLAGKVWVAQFFFTHCPTICPRITRRMRALQVAEQKRHAPVRLVSFSVDPDDDTPPVLLAYAKEYGADLSNWTFLTGNFNVLKHTCVDGFKMALQGHPGKDPSAMMHSSHLALVDGTMHIRGYYDTASDAAMKRLAKDAALLAKQ